jgi:hypothetical protein
LCDRRKLGNGGYDGAAKQEHERQYTKPSAHSTANYFLYILHDESGCDNAVVGNVGCRKQRDPVKAGSARTGSGVNARNARETCRSAEAHFPPKAVGLRAPSIEFGQRSALAVSSPLSRI